MAKLKMSLHLFFLNSLMFQSVVYSVAFFKRHAPHMLGQLMRCFLNSVHIGILWLAEIDVRAAFVFLPYIFRENIDIFITLGEVWTKTWLTCVLQSCSFKEEQIKCYCYMRLNIYVSVYHFLWGIIQDWSFYTTCSVLKLCQLKACTQQKCQC